MYGKMLIASKSNLHGMSIEMKASKPASVNGAEIIASSMARERDTDGARY